MTSNLGDQMVIGCDRFRSRMEEAGGDFKDVLKFYPKTWGHDPNCTSFLFKMA